MNRKSLGSAITAWILSVSVFGAPPPRSTPQLANAANSPATTNNDDSCDISVAPAATLLLPYFEVDFASTQAKAAQTIVTITNVSAYPQIAHVTLWTDWAYPILDFNIFLTGYDVQNLNLYDVIARGRLQPTTRNNPPGGPSPPGPRSLYDSANPSLASVGCNDLGTAIDPGLITDIQAALTTGVYASACGAKLVGGKHVNAIGYVTIDVTSVCSSTLPTSPDYYASEILFDNVLIGDYQQINPDTATGNYAGGNPMVHIRAVPEGGPAGGAIPTTLPYTFYDRYTPAGSPTLDRRQPLPSQFAARFIEGGSSGFFTNFKMWREGIAPGITCDSVSSNSKVAITEIIRFDEHENAFGFAPQPIGTLDGRTRPFPIDSPATSSQATTSLAAFPQFSTAARDKAGWMYLNLNDGGSPFLHAQRPFTDSPATQALNTNIATGSSNPGGGVPSTKVIRPSQNWVVISMFAESRYSVEFDAASLGNGCSLSPAINPLIGPNGGLITPQNRSGNVTP